jgi:hypothetical protein
MGGKIYYRTNDHEIDVTTLSAEQNAGCAGNLSPMSRRAR